jgi:hypothetical protein
LFEIRPVPGKLAVSDFNHLFNLIVFQPVINDLKLALSTDSITTSVKL